MQLVELDANHPGFRDSEYRQRRNQIAQLAARAAELGSPLQVEYTETENQTWSTVYDRLVQLYPSHACHQYNQILPELGFSRDRMPQLAEVSSFLTRRTGFKLQAVAGLVSPREFLTALARRTFCATQYIRHSSRPFYTPEPDVVHELLGHAAMLADPDLADLSQKIGEGALKADERQVERLATLYWFTIEFGVLEQAGELRAYGAGLLSSFGELEHALSGEVEIRPLDPDVAADTSYPITTYQPLLWRVESLQEAYDKLSAFIQ